MSFDLLSEPIRKYIRDKRWEELRPIQTAAISKILTTDDNYILASRTASGKAISYDDITSEILSEYSIIINCTPLGTFPNVQEGPPLPYDFLNASHYLFDLVYNPLITKFLQYGKNVNCTIQNGYEMLVIQAEENWEIWNS